VAQLKGEYSNRLKQADIKLRLINWNKQFILHPSIQQTRSTAWKVQRAALK